VYFKFYIFFIKKLFFFFGNELICKEREASDRGVQLEMIPLPKKETYTSTNVRARPFWE
jgi:hypothetical protein